ncbi:spore coat protein GerQ [Metabacillus herbersteinensis]|uniref:Spore coat protein GerQ n=1 Tax=Metabacillus herbersteinensis TaxID=283816 RepID=A0ABV6GFG6_9BACI
MAPKKPQYQAQQPYGYDMQGMQGVQGAQSGPGMQGQGQMQGQPFPQYSTYPFQGQYQQGQQMPTQQAPSQNGTGMLPLEESYIENIIRLNRGKTATVYMTFEGNNNKTFKGVIEAAGRDHIILSEPQTQKRYVLLMVYLDYITFDEEIEYSYPYNPASYSPR